MAARLPREALDQRPVQQPARDGDDEHEEDAERWQVQARCMTLLPELLIAGHEPSDPKDQLPERGGTEAGSDADHHSHRREP